jgi:A118 family predicted phage portal protein
MNDTLAKDLQKLFIGRGYNPVIGTIYQQQEYWLSWYRGEVDGFHNIQKKNAEGTLIPIYKPSLQMAKKVGEDITSLMFNENVALTVSGDDNAQDVLDMVLDNNHFYDEMPNFIELTVVPFGTGVAVEYLADNETKINYLFGDRVVVIDYDNTTPTAIAAIQQFQREKKKYFHITEHTFQDGKYRIQHSMYSNKSGQGLGNPDSLGVLFSEKELKSMRHVRKEENTEIVEYYVEYETEVPHFQVFKLGISNNFDVRSPMGISSIANATGTLENIDEKYYSSRMDSINSRKKLFIDEEAAKISKTVDGSGSISYKKYFDQDETQYQVLKNMGADGNKAIEMYAPTYDSAQHDNAIQMELNYLSSKVGLGTNYYSYSNGAVGYQNEMNVIASNSDTFRNRKKNLNRLKSFLIDMMKSIMFLEKETGKYKGNLDILEYDVQFDDDIMTDDATVVAQYRKDAEDGVIPYEMYLMKAYKISEEEAEELAYETTGVNVKKIEAVSRGIESGAISIKEAQRILNPELSDEELEITYIRTLVEKGIALTPAQAELYNSLEIPKNTNGTVTVENDGTTPMEDNEEDIE